jgi:hemoglobin-like flavoprotein
MTPEQIRTVRETFALVAPSAGDVAALFYDHLFARDPSLRALFRGDMAEQGRKLMQMIGAAVGLLDKPETLVPVLQRLGERHAGYRVTPAHYDTVGAALLQTLADGLGERFDAPTREAWTAMYVLASRTMIEAAERAELTTA